MSKMIILQGPPCAGKSTWARREVSGKEDWIIVSRDDIRHALGDYWNLKREPLVTSTEDFVIKQGLRMKFNIIVDSVNLKKERVSHLQKIADDEDAIVEFKTLIVPFLEAVRRDRNPDRQHRTGVDVIRDYYQTYYPNEPIEDIPADLAVTPAPPADPDRIILDTEGNPVWRPTPADLANVKKLAILRYSFSAISMAIGVPQSEFRRLMADSSSPLYEAYHAGKIEGEMAYRQKVVNIANSGEEWAVRMIEAWNREQLKEEKGFQA
mgnify:CR=1 FL=1